MNKIVFIFSLIVLVSSCKGKPASRRDNEIGDETHGAISQTERASDFVEEYERAAKLISEKKISGAIAIYEQLLLKESKKDLAFAGLGACYNLEDKCDLAISCYQKALMIDSNCISALVGMGSAYYCIKDYDNAILYYNRVKVKNVTLAESYWGLAIAYDAKGEEHKAKENAKRFIELAPGSMYRKQIEAILQK